MSFAGQVVHVMGKDLQRFWPWLVGAGLVAWMALLGVPERVWLVSAFGGYSITELLPLLLAGLAALMVLEDGPSLDLPFWLSRPLSPGAVLGAKLFVVFGVLVALPAVGHTFWLLSFGAADPWPLLIDTLVMHGGMVSLIVLAAVVSGSVLSFLAVAFAGWIGYGVLEGVLGLEFLSTPPASPEVSLTRSYLLRLVWLTTGATFTVYQYRTRATARTVALAGAVLVASVWIARNAGLDWTVPAGPPEFRPLAADVPAPELHPQDMNWNSFPMGDEGNPTPVLQASFTVASDPGYFAVERDPGARLLSHRGEKLSYFPGALRMPSGWRQALARLDALDGSKRLYPREWTSQTIVPLVWGDWDEVSARLEGAEGFEVTMEQDVYRFAVAAKLPFAVGATGRTEAVALSVTQAEHRGSQAFALVQARRPGRRLEPLNPDVPQVLAVLLHNPERRQFLAQSGGSVGRPRPASLIPGGGVYEQSFWLEFSPAPRWAANGEPPLDDNWFEDLEFWVVTAEYVGTVQNAVAVSVDEWPEFVPGGRVDAGSLRVRSDGRGGGLPGGDR